MDKKETAKNFIALFEKYGHTTDEELTSIVKMLFNSNLKIKADDLSKLPPKEQIKIIGVAITMKKVMKEMGLPLNESDFENQHQAGK